MIGSHQSDLETPALCLNLDRLEERLREIRSFAEANGKGWRARCLFPQVPEFVSQLAGAAPHGLAVADMKAAGLLSVAGVKDLLIWRPVVGAEPLQRLSGLCGSAEPIVVCDHYAQAEAISDRIHETGLRCRVLVEVNLGLNRSGVRPGSDARELARGLLNLPGITIAGVMGDLGRCGPESPTSANRISSRLDILQELRAQMIRDGIRAPVITTFAEDAFAGLCRMNGIDEVQGDPLNLPDGDGSSPRGTIQADPIMKVIGTVLSRPKLERAVLDVGHRSLAATCQTFRITRTAAGRELPDVTTEEIGPETMTLALGPASRDLIIGETVEIWPAEITLTAIRHRTLFGVRNGIAEWMRPL